MQTVHMLCESARVRERIVVFFFLMIRRPPRSTQSRSSAASDVYKRQEEGRPALRRARDREGLSHGPAARVHHLRAEERALSLIHISEPTRPY